MTASKIRQQFIDFFKEKQHTFVPSAPVVPLDDPTLLFTNAGMNQFKDIFLEQGTRTYKRAVNSQKCIRVSGKHNDLEEVGRDTYHHTFFEMLGNWSFGDYYKAEAIRWAWELLTDVWKLPKDKLYATVYNSDDEAAELWAKETDIAKERILRFGDKDNFWEMGATGPCGPSSEIHIDLGPEHCDKQGIDHVCGVNGDCGRYIELWNLVFIQYNRDEQGKLHPLPHKHVDTGAGFERLVAVLQHKASNYDTDVFMPLLNFIADLTGIDYQTSSEQMAFRVIADHVRMLTFSISDGALPSNEGRGYVMRRILRRAARYGRKLNMKEPFIYKLVPKVVELMAEAYPELPGHAEHVMSVIRKEEEQFNRTLDRGLDIFDKIKTELRAKGQTVIPGAQVFKLYDTYGFPVDLTAVLAEENGLTIDSTGFEKEMEAQRERARAHSKFGSQSVSEAQWHTLSEGADSEFIGYTALSAPTEIRRFQSDEHSLRVVLAQTPFYAESGGQVGDTGRISGKGFELEVVDTVKEGDAIVHLCAPMEDFNPHSPVVTAVVTGSRRREIMKNHTATHLLHAALRTVLGAHVHQAGSLVQPERLRFDFTHSEKITPEQLRTIETMVNEKIQENLSLDINEESFAEAQKRGAMALFGEKYGDVVRTVSIPGFSLELCGGTHVRATGEIGVFLIQTESSISSGVRRIEALTGHAAVDYLLNARDRLTRLGQLLNAKEDAIADRVNELLEQKKALTKELGRLSAMQLFAQVDQILASAEEHNDKRVFTFHTKDVDMNQLKELGDRIRTKATATVGLISCENDGKLNFVCIVSDDLVQAKTLNAGQLVREVAKVAGGGGGGRPHLATAGAKDVSKLQAAIERFKELV